MPGCGSKGSAFFGWREGQGAMFTALREPRLRRVCPLSVEAASARQVMSATTECQAWNIARCPTSYGRTEG
jgi:hypothetical protein